MERYCPSCGQAAPTDSDYSISAHARELVEHVTSTDGKTARTLWTLVTRPGELTSDHLHGKRARYLRPLQLFLLVNVLLFISAPHVPLFSYSLEKYLHHSPPSPGLVNEMVRRVTPAGHTHDAAAGGNEFTMYEQRFDSLVDVQRKSLVILFAPALAGLLAIVFRKRRERPGRFGEHLIFALHLLSFVWLVLAAVGGLARAAGGVIRLERLGGIFLIVVAASLLGWAVTYLYRSLRAVYGLTPGKGLIVGALTIAIFTGLLIGYRGLLFFTTYYAL